MSPSYPKIPLECPPLTPKYPDQNCGDRFLNSRQLYRPPSALELNGLMETIANLIRKNKLHLMIFRESEAVSYPLEERIRAPISGKEFWLTYAKSKTMSDFFGPFLGLLRTRRTSWT